MIEVHLDADDRLEWALKAFKKKVQKAGILKELQQKRHYLAQVLAQFLAEVLRGELDVTID